MLALDPGLLSDRATYMKRSHELVESIKDARPLPGQIVRLPGERGDDLARSCEISGEVDIPEEIWWALGKFIVD